MTRRLSVQYPHRVVLLGNYNEISTHLERQNLFHGWDWIVRSRGEMDTWERGQYVMRFKDPRLAVLVKLRWGGSG